MGPPAGSLEQDHKIFRSILSGPNLRTWAQVERTVDPNSRIRCLHTVNFVSSLKKFENARPEGDVLESPTMDTTLWRRHAV
jgi:hypothetical protein